MPMKVLFISCWYPTKKNSLKGIFIKRYAEAIKTSGIHITVLALDISYATYLYKKTISVEIINDIPTHSISIESRFYKLLLINTIMLS
jgi:hypothetical protein